MFVNLVNTESRAKFHLTRDRVDAIKFRLLGKSIPLKYYDLLDFENLMVTFNVYMFAYKEQLLCLTLPAENAFDLPHPHIGMFDVSKSRVRDLSHTEIVRFFEDLYSQDSISQLIEGLTLPTEVFDRGEVVNDVEMLVGDYIREQRPNIDYSDPNMVFDYFADLTQEEQKEACRLTYIILKKIYNSEYYPHLSWEKGEEPLPF